jgi:predicted CXXCH cytochrome family protein
MKRRAGEQRLRGALVLGSLATIVGCATDQRDALLDLLFDRAHVSRGPEIGTVAAGTSAVLEQRKPPSLHAPYANRECIRCHGGIGSELVARRSGPQEEGFGFNFTDVDGAAMRTARTKCLTCHADPKEVSPRSLIAPAGAWLHGPVANVQCDRCHLPHLSAFPNLLKSDRAEPLCLECHENQRRTAAMGKLDCTVCHDPHKADSPDARFLKQTKPGGLCLDCHGKLFEDPTRPWLHAPVAAGLCSACHSPHAGDARAIRRPLRDACVTCHDPVALDARAEHRQDKGECDRCHDPHMAGSPEEHFLRQR